jgi:HD-like signal output (HDOD) protein
MKDIFTYIQKTKYLPQTPDLMMKLVECFQNPDLDIDEIVSLIELDPAVTAEALKCCNSSFFATERPVLDISEAVLRIGFYELYQISMAVFARQSMVAKNIRGVDVKALWRHSAITAITARRLAHELDETEGAAFTAGILHDIGKIVFASAEGERYGKMIRDAQSSGISLATMEIEAFGFDHAELGGCLLGLWRMPMMISDPVLQHHQLAWSGPQARLEAIVCLANRLAYCIEGMPLNECCALPEVVAAKKFLGLKKENASAILMVVQSDMRRLKPLISPAVQPSKAADRALDLVCI